MAKARTKRDEALFADIRVAWPLRRGLKVYRVLAMDEAGVAHELRVLSVDVGKK